jgi:hypothetical protein
MTAKPRTQKSQAQECQNLLHAIRLTSPYDTPRIRTCVECGEEVLLDVQVYPQWLTEALRDVVFDEKGNPVLSIQDGQPMRVYGIGYAEDFRGRNWERLREHYVRYHPAYAEGEPSNTPDDSEE